MLSNNSPWKEDKKWLTMFLPGSSFVTEISDGTAAKSLVIFKVKWKGIEEFLSIPKIFISKYFIDFSSNDKLFTSKREISNLREIIFFRVIFPINKDLFFNNFFKKRNEEKGLSLDEKKLFFLENNKQTVNFASTLKDSLNKKEKINSLFLNN